MMTELKIGDRAPNFHATAVGGKYGTGREVSLVDFRKAPLALYFTQRTIPRDAPSKLAVYATPGTT
jgi:peroxiredoxin